jgi:hypothetical protein
MSVQSEMAAMVAGMFEGMFADRCMVESDAGTQDADGGLKSSWQTLHSGVPCCEAPYRGVEQTQQGKVLASTQSVWFMPAVLDDGSLNGITAEHRFTVQARAPLVARTLYAKDVSAAGGIYLVVKAEAEG